MTKLPPSLQQLLLALNPGETTDQWPDLLASLAGAWPPAGEAPANTATNAAGASTTASGVPHAAWLPLFAVNPQGRVLYTTPVMQNVLGYGPELVGRHLRELLYSPLERLRLKLLLEGLQRRGEAGEMEVIYSCQDGRRRTLTTRVLPRRLPAADETAGAGAGLEVVFACLWPEAMAAREQLFNGHLTFYESLLESLPAPVAILDAEGRYVYCNSQAIRSPEIREWIVGKTDPEYVAYRGFDPDMGQRRQQHFRKAVAGQKTVSFEEHFVAPDGSDIYQWRTHTPIFGEGGQLAFVLGHGIEVTELRRTQQELQAINAELEMRVQARTAELEALTRQLQYDASHDSLTGLPNRALFSDRLEQAIERAAGNGPAYAVLFLDTDRFKGINDTLGHPSGDALLRELGRRLRSVVRASDTVARLGGDEFTVLLQPVSSVAEVTQVAARIREELRRPVRLAGPSLVEPELGGLDMAVSVSMGIVMGSAGTYTSAVDVIRDADIAMYRAKAAGRDGYQLFEAQMREQTIAFNRLASELRRALSADELRVVYQPIVGLAGGQVRGFEALVRWQHPERGFISPADFLPVAEESGLLLDIDRWVLRRACLEMQEWQGRYPQLEPLTLSVNFSARHFASVKVVDDVQATLEQTGFEARQLKLEITESALLGHPETVTSTLERLRILGIGLHLDDFGTGYSSLSYLHSYPLDTLKIDRSFVQAMSSQTRSAELVRTIVAMAQNMKMQVVAEGIEEAAQMEVLRELHCDDGQGFYFSRPVPAAEAWAYAQQALTAAQTEQPT